MSETYTIAEDSPSQRATVRKTDKDGNVTRVTLTVNGEPQSLTKAEAQSLVDAGVVLETSSGNTVAPDSGDGDNPPS